MRVVITARDLPGRTWEDQDDIHVGIQVGRTAADLVPGDADGASWETDVEPTADGDFRGPAVQGKKNERFLYLVWVAGPQREMFRRIKLMLADAPVGTTARASLSLTDPRGGPVCGRVKPPAVVWATD
jgi:hypothetical protein